MRPRAKAKLIQPPNDLATRIFRKLKGARGVNLDELWQHALFFAMSPQERCHASLKAARSALSLKIGRLEGVEIRILPLRRVIASKQAANRENDIAVLPILRRTLRLAARLKPKR